jgi:hypothetical protein
MSNPFNKMSARFGQMMPSANNESPSPANAKVFNAMETIEPGKQGKKLSEVRPTPVILPDHLFMPKGVQSLDLRKVVNLPFGTTDFELFRFEAPPGAITKFISYGIFNDGDNGVNYNFRPLVDGSRVFPYHGDPSLNYKIYLGLGPDLSNAVLIPCQLSLQPGQVLTWLVTNISAVDTSMGVRMVGYFDTVQVRVNERFG